MKIMSFNLEEVKIKLMKACQSTRDCGQVFGIQPKAKAWLVAKGGWSGIQKDYSMKIIGNIKIIS